MTLFLASVTSVAEARLAAQCGADVIDCKDPAQGALGALPVATVAAICQAVPAGIPVSATIGDLPFTPQAVVPAVVQMAQSGCDIVKIGVFPGGDPHETLAALGRLNLGRVRLAGLLLADQNPDFSLIADMADAGFAGVMVDTAAKGAGSLRDHLSPARLASFVNQAHGRGLFAGFAGSLRLSDIEPLMRLKPNVLGFRGALCTGAIRTRQLSNEAIEACAAAIGTSPGSAAGWRWQALTGPSLAAVETT